MAEHDNGRPLAGAPAYVTDTDSNMVDPILPNVTDVIGHCHAVLVMTPRGRWQRRLYLSLHSADRAMARARARGQVVHCIMVKLVPVGGGDQ